jgi:hypothetical protein
MTSFSVLGLGQGARIVRELIKSSRHAATESYPIRRMAGGSGEEVRREMNRYKRGRTKSGLGGGVVNLKTANGMGIEIPASILLRAEKVIE